MIVVSEISQPDTKGHKLYESINMKYAVQVKP